MMLWTLHRIDYVNARIYILRSIGEQLKSIPNGFNDVLAKRASMSTIVLYKDKH